MNLQLARVYDIWINMDKYDVTIYIYNKLVFICIHAVKLNQQS